MTANFFRRIMTIMSSPIKLHPIAMMTIAAEAFQASPGVGQHLPAHPRHLLLQALTPMMAEVV